jgi:tRNA nucleotidyltransferase (CCA-adding enzyme)
MEGNRPMSTAEKPKESLAEALQRVYPELDAVREAATEPVYLVGGAVRDLLLGRGRADIDIVVEGDAAALAARLGAEMVAHERFGTAKAKLDGHELDIAAARSESYPHPGALPVVEPAATIEGDLGRRDFTINAMAIPLLDEPRLIDPYGGKADLAAKRLRVLRPESFADDPTRAIRAARYAARFGFGLESETAALLRGANLGTVSVDRREAELLRLASEPSAPDAYLLLEKWGLIELREGGAGLARRVGELLELPLWQLRAERNRVVHAAATGEPGGEVELTAADPSRPSEAVALMTAYGAVEMVLARADGAEWLDDYLEKWSQIELEIDGNDLIAAGVTEGKAVGRGLAEAKRRKLDGEIAGRDEELEVALTAARSGDGGA